MMLTNMQNKLTMMIKILYADVVSFHALCLSHFADFVIFRNSFDGSKECAGSALTSLIANMLESVLMGPNWV